MLRSSLLLVIVLSACNDDTPTARKSLGGVDGQRALRDLDDDQRERVCDAANTKLAAAFDEPGTDEGACLLVAHITARGLTAGNDELDETDVCEGELAACPEERDSSYRCDSPVAESCRGTVADFDRCITLVNDVYRELGTLDCEDVSRDDTDELDAQIQASVEACDRLAGCFLGEVPDSGTPDASVIDGGELDGGELDSGEPDDDAGL